MTRFATHPLLALISLTCPAMADDIALYDTPAPSDAVFVRLLSEYDGPTDRTPIGNARVDLGDMPRDTYVAISAADLPTPRDGIEAGRYYSLARSQTSARLIAEPGRETAVKVHLILLNTGSAPVRLILPSAGAEVIAPLPAGSAASRAVNPVRATVAVERVSDGQILGQFDLALTRGQNLTFVVEEDSARMLENRFGPVVRDVAARMK